MTDNTYLPERQPIIPSPPPKMAWTYTDTDGRLLGFAFRYDTIRGQILDLWRGDGISLPVEFVAGGRGLVALVAYLFPHAVVSFGKLLVIDAYE